MDMEQLREKLNTVPVIECKNTDVMLENYAYIIYGNPNMVFQIPKGRGGITVAEFRELFELHKRMFCCYTGGRVSGLTTDPDKIDGEFFKYRKEEDE